MDIYKIKQYNPKYRVLETNKQVKQGQLILQCQPISHAVISSMRTKICSNCLKQQTQLLRCSKCKIMFYCNKQCQLEDWAFHKQQCKPYQSISQKNFKITSQFILLARTYLTSQKSKQTKQQLNKFLQLPESQSPSTREYFVEMSTVFADNFNIQKSEDNMSYLIRLLGIISINTFTIQDYLFNHSGIAIGLYSPANFINHSCNPNSVQVFNGKQLNIIALRNIDAEEQITISYLDETLSLAERNKILKQSYFFDCSCFQCLAQKAVQRDVIDILCEKCQDGNLIIFKEGFACHSCKSQYSQAQLKQKRQEIAKLQAILLEQHPYQKTIKSYYSLKKQLKFTNPFYAKVLLNLYHQALQKAQTDESNIYFTDAYKIMKAYFHNFPKWYHMDQGQKFHILLLWKYAQMGKLAMHLGKPKKAVEYTEKAIFILQKSRLSSQFQEVRDLKKRHQELRIECRINATSRYK